MIYEVVKDDEFSIFLNEYDKKDYLISIDSLDQDYGEIEKQFRRILYDIRKKYSVNVSGAYEVDVYILNDFGCILNFKKKESKPVDYLDHFIEMKVYFKEYNFLMFKFYDYDYTLLFNGDNIYYRDNYYSIFQSDRINDLEKLFLFEFGSIVYKEIDQVMKNGIKV